MGNSWQVAKVVEYMTNMNKTVFLIPSFAFCITSQITLGIFHCQLFLYSDNNKQKTMKTGRSCR